MYFQLKVRNTYADIQDFKSVLMEASADYEGFGAVITLQIFITLYLKLMFHFGSLELT